MSFKVSIEKFSLKHELSNLSLTILFGLLPIMIDPLSS